MAVKVLTDSTSCLDEMIARELNIRIVSLSLSFGEDIIREVDIENDVFYKMMAEKGIPTSSQPSVGEMYDEMSSIVANGDDLCCVFISSEFSGSYNSALIARNMVLEKYKQAKIEVVDSRSSGMQLGYAAMASAKAALEGKSLEQAKEAALENMRRSRFLFIPDSLEYLKKGGRIGDISALFGDLFKIIPILTVVDGRMTVFKKVRTKKNAILAMTDKMFQDIRELNLGEAVVLHINCINEAKELAKGISEKLKATIRVVDIGPVIGLHVGPGSMGIVYYTLLAMR